MTTPRSHQITRKREPVALSSDLNRKLAAYAATGAAGLGLAFSPNAEAAIEYTSARVAGAPNSTTAIDLNHDGIGDFSIHDYFYSESGITAGTVLASALNQNGVGFDNGPYAHAFTAGDLIGPAYKFEHSPVVMPMAISVLSSEGVIFAAGEFLNQTNKFLGLKFVLNGETYYGWARVNVKSHGHGQIYIELIDYAYQNKPNTGILAGEGIKKNGAGSLGELAVGADGMQFWRGTSAQ